VEQTETVSPLVEPPNSVLLLVGREEFTPPGSFGDAACVATTDCIAVGVLSVDDGPTLASLAQSVDTSQFVTLGEFSIQSEGRLSLRDVYNREYDFLGVDVGLVRVTVLANDVSEPCQVTFLVDHG